MGALTINADGTLLATASVKGTIIKIFAIEEGDLIQELRRGSGKAAITSIVFHPTLNLIACTSNRTSIHLFEIKKSADKDMSGDNNQAQGENKKSK